MEKRYAHDMEYLCAIHDESEHLSGKRILIMQAADCADALQGDHVMMDQTGKGSEEPGLEAVIGYILIIGVVISFILERMFTPQPRAPGINKVLDFKRDFCFQ
jgi:hypothetical protein